MALLTKAAILAAKPQTRDVEAFGGTVRVKAMSIADRLALLDDFKANAQAHEDYVEDQKLPVAQQKGLPLVELFDQAILQLIHTIVDARGNRLFGLADYAAIKALDYATIQNLFRAFLDLNSPPAPDAKKN